ncbi:MurR/RpiR family transcriptional regulator [Halomonas binhaiensis]|uniref:MurR/RpiR family transcriptional regulator n=1 Tax=Halomonas binhaiensis TaxID=2562282 RepID=A0A5C1NHI8_9GAMM|nr:MurR/RpiR family transcriptional regulator [Halomonas binhaiensis]QEM82291.1 MurR/RpiR family transcriptional regulator [Halomonas binhaiensis]
MTDAPATLDALQTRLEDIRTGHSETRLGKRSQRVLATLLDTPQQSAVSSISDLAQRLSVNASTLTRLAQRLGYGGFSELQEVFRRELTDGGRHFYSDLAAKLATDRQQGGGLERLVRMGRQESANFSGLLARLDADTYQRSVEKLATAKRVRVHGQRQFASLASFLAYGLGMLRSEVSILNPGNHGTADALAQMEPDDVLIAISCFPYTTSVVTTAQVAARHGINVIALTDGEHSPLAQVATETFHVPNDSLFFSNSMCAFMLLAQGLLSEVADTLGDRGLEALKQREKMIQELGAAL